MLERDAEEELPRLILRQLRHSPSPPPESVVSEETPSESTAPTTPTTPRSPIFGKSFLSRFSGGPKSGANLWQGSEPQVRTLNKQINLLRLIPVVVGGVQGD